jgi:endonuclease/exonuclease/phosphatase family metal-dependent hydrolase
MDRRRLTGLAGCLALALGLAACGETEKSVAPPAVNPFEAAKVGTDTTLEVMTWNIENFPKAGATTIGDVRQIIEGVQPDIVAVEEIANGASFEQLDAQLTGWVGTHASSDAYQNLGFLYRADGALSVTSVYEIYTDDSRAFPRSPYVLEATWNGTPFVVIANHLKASGDGVMNASDPYDEETRRRDACVLLAEFVTTSLAGERVFIVGDMNDLLTDVEANNVFEVFLQDPADWRFADLAIAQGPAGGFSYPNYNSHLDHILVTSALFPALDAPGTLVTTMSQLPAILGGWASYDRDVSDHLPVIVRLRP